MSPRGTRRIIGRFGSKHSFWGLTGIAVLLLSACAPGTYQVEVFPEQHYQSSHKRQEPPRLTAPEDSVPVTGRELALSFDQANTTTNPCAAGCAPATMPSAQVNLATTTDVMAHGAEIFRVNCSMCHGPKGDGNGTVGSILVSNGYAKPPDLTAPTTQNRSDGSLFWVITNGVVVMPKFGHLLPEQDRWAVVSYLRYLAQPSAPAAAAPAPASPTPAAH